MTVSCCSLCALQGGRPLSSSLDIISRSSERANGAIEYKDRLCYVLCDLSGAASSTPKKTGATLPCWLPPVFACVRSALRWPLLQLLQQLLSPPAVLLGALRGVPIR
jgi:hypothetical protein